MPIFKLTLHKTYYEKGFFNVTVDFDRYVRDDEGEVILHLTNTGQRIKSRVDRRSNQNGTARIMGGSELRDWFQKYFGMMEVVNVDLSSKEVVRLGKSSQ
jgi:hypothetical protein